MNKTVAILTTKGIIAAAIYRITLTHVRYSLYFTMGREMPPTLPVSLGRIRATT